MDTVLGVLAFITFLGLLVYIFRLENKNVGKEAERFRRFIASYDKQKDQGQSH